MLRVAGFTSLVVSIVLSFGCGEAPRPVAQTSLTLPIPPALAISSLSPAVAVAGSPGFKLTVELQQSGQVNLSFTQLIWSANGTDTPLKTTLVDSNTVTASVPADLITKPVEVKVFLEFGDAMGISDGVTPGKTVAVPFSVTGSAITLAESSTAISGNWTGRFVANMGDGHSVDAEIRGPLLESSGAVQQTGLALKSSTCFTAVQVRSGSRSGSTVELSMVAADFASIQFSGTLSANKLSGTFRIDGSECGSGTGTLNMTRLPAATGTWSGSLRDRASGIQSPITASLTQTSTILNSIATSAPFKTSSTKVTGIVRQAGSGCALQILSQTPGVLGSIQGTDLKVRSNGAPGLSLRGSFNLSATSFSGTYEVNGTVCDGQTGTFSLNRQ